MCSTHEDKLPVKNFLGKGRENPPLGPLGAVLSSSTRQFSRWLLLGGARWHQISAGGRLISVKIRLRVLQTHVSWAPVKAKLFRASDSDDPCC